jgi:hydrogenase maturation protease
MTAPTRPRILIGGIGNIFLGDDAFGVVVAQQLLQQPWRVGVSSVGGSPVQAARFSLN